MSRIALYRTYRSADFDDVVGQQHVTRTLQAAVEKGLVSHAYLLTGPRGTGKTSIARILARRVNGLPAETDLSTELDIIEIDAASNRGIDEMRSLREKIASAPTRLKYKVYIIDEVHMLTREAFNALLKTLEEPPAHAIFILATTEAHKLPETIISRTQRFDLRPIAQADLVARLSQIAKAEKIEIDQDALDMIATASRGGFRDAIGLLDQLSVLGSKITAEQLTGFLGMATRQDVDALLGAIAEQDSAQALNQLERLIAAGNEPLSLTHQLLDSLRQRLLSTDKAHEQVMSQDQLSRAISCLISALANFKVTQHYSLPLELAIYQASQSSLPAPNLAAAAIQPAQAVQKPQSAKPASKSTTPPATAPKRPTSDVDEASLCTKGLSLIKESNNSLYAVIRSANPRVEGDSFVLECPFSFHKERIEEHKNRQTIEKIMSKTFGREITLVCKLVQPKKEAQPADSDMELVSSALEILGGEVVSG